MNAYQILDRIFNSILGLESLLSELEDAEFSSGKVKDIKFNCDKELKSLNEIKKESIDKLIRVIGVVKE